MRAAQWNLTRALLGGLALGLVVLPGCASEPLAAPEPEDPALLAWTEAHAQAERYLEAKRFGLALDQVEHAVALASQLESGAIPVLLTDELVHALSTRPRIGDPWVIDRYMALFRSTASAENAYVRGSLAMRIGLHHYHSSRIEAATRFNRTAVTALEAEPPAPREDLQPASELYALSLANLFLSLRREGKHQEAAGVGADAISLKLRFMKSSDPSVLRTQAVLGTTYAAMEQWERARELLARSLPGLRGDPASAHSLPFWHYTHAMVLTTLGENSAADEEFSKSMAGIEAGLREDPGPTVQNLMVMTQGALSAQRWTWARRTLNLQLELYRSAKSGPKALVLGRVWIQLAMVNGILGRTVEAEQQYQRAFQLLARLRGVKAREIRGSGMMLYSRLLAMTGRTLQATAAAQQAEAMGASEDDIPNALRPALGLAEIDQTGD